MNIPEGTGDKIFKGCGCISIGVVLMFILVIIIGVAVDDEDADDKKAAQTEQVEKKDSLVVNGPLEGDPYKELDELIEGRGALACQFREDTKAARGEGTQDTQDVPPPRLYW